MVMENLSCLSSFTLVSYFTDLVPTTWLKAIAARNNLLDTAFSTLNELSH